MAINSTTIEVALVKFNDSLFSKSGSFSIGIEEESGRSYISIPVRNHLVEYEEYFEISADEYNKYLGDIESAIHLANRYRLKHEDDRLFYKPSKIRGTPT